MEWSKYSQALFNALEDTTDNLQVNACPGSGKTTNCKHIWEINPNNSIAYLVFNKANADEAKSKLKARGEDSFIGTLHSLGMTAITRVLGKGKFQVDTQRRKVRKLIWDMYPFLGDKLATVKQSDIYKLVSIMKGYATDDLETVRELIAIHDMEGFPGLEQAALDVYHASLANHKVVDFDDMLLFPVVHKPYREALPHYKLVLGDEGQDFNPVQINLLATIAERVVVVGDPRQAIYGFRGALNDALGQVQQRFNATVLPLKLSYRCPKLIVQEAQHVYPEDIEALDTAPDGIIRHIMPQEHMAEDYRIERSTLIVCRNMAPLVQFCYLLLRRKVPARLRGRDIGQNLIAFIKKLQADSLPDMLNKLDDWRMEAESIARGKGDDDKLQAIEDKYLTVIAFEQACEGTSLVQLYDMIEYIFSSDYGVELSTIHRAKGLEHNRVYILYPDLMPSRYARQPWQQTQESNLRYVAITRAKQELIYLTR